MSGPGVHARNIHPTTDHFYAGGSATTLGLIRHAVLPSFAFHAGLNTLAYGVARYTDRADAKDWVWMTGQVANAWWSALGRRVVLQGVSVSAAWAALSYPLRLLLVGASAWGARLAYHVVSRSIARGADDPRYVDGPGPRKAPGFWNAALFTLFLLEALAQTLVSLPLVLPFRGPQAAVVLGTPAGSVGYFRALAVFLFSAGLAFETLADAQLAAHQDQQPGYGRSQLCRGGVWSIVRHPNYLGDALCHLSFPVLLYSARLLSPLAVLGPLANYAFLRLVGGDRQSEAYAEKYATENPVRYRQLQKYKAEKNSFWPRIGEWRNTWLWAVIGLGALGVGLERLAAKMLQ